MPRLFPGKCSSQSGCFLYDQFQTNVIVILFLIQQDEDYYFLVSRKRVPQIDNGSPSVKYPSTGENFPNLEQTGEVHTFFQLVPGLVGVDRAERAIL